METTGRITLTDAGGNSVTFDMGSDGTNPYSWIPNNNDLATWANSFATRSNKTLTVSFDDNEGVTLPTLANQAGRRGTPYSQTLPEATGGTAPYTYAATGLPDGLSFNTATRRITGTPTREAAFTVTYTATDSDTPAATVSETFTLTVAAPLPVSIPTIAGQSAPRGGEASVQLPEATGGIAPFTYGATGLPDGLSFDADTRRITGTPTREAEFTVTYTATDSDTPTAGTASAMFAFTITAPAALVLGQPEAQSGVEGRVFSATLPLASGGFTPYTYAATGLPDGLSFDADTRIISGTPTRSGTFTVAYTVTDSDTPARTATRTFDITLAGPLKLARPGPMRAINGERFTVQLPEATDGSPPYAYTAQPLPAGIRFTPGNRILTGIPGGVSSTTVTYRVLDSLGDSVSRTFVINVATVPDDATYRLEVDWDGDGTFGHDLANVWDDLIDVDAERGRNFNESVYGRSLAGRLDAELRNDSGRYSRFNSESPLFKLVVPGRRVRLRMRTSRSAAYETIWGGQLFDVEADPQRSGDDRVTLTAFGPLADLTQREISVPMQSGVRHPVEGATAYDPANAHRTRAFPANITPQGFAFDGTRYIAVSSRNVHAFGTLNDLGNPAQLGQLPNDGNRSGLAYRRDRDVLVSVIGNNIEVFSAANPAGAVTRAIGATGTAAFVGICWDGSRYVLARSDRTIWHFTDETDPSDDVTMGGTLPSALVVGATLAGGIDWDGTHYVVGAGDDQRRLLLFTNRNNAEAAVNAGAFADSLSWGDGDVCWDGDRITVGGLEAGTAQVQGGNVALRAMAMAPATRLQTSEATITTAQAGALVFAALGTPEWQRGPLRGTRTMARWWVAKQRAMESLRQLEETEGGILLETKDGRIAMDAENARVSKQIQHVLNADTADGIPVQDVVPHDPVKDVFNVIEVPLRNYEVGIIEVVWQMPFTVGLAADEAISFIAEYPPPSNPAAAIGIEEWIPLAPVIDYTANSLADGTGTVRNSDLSIIVKDSANRRVMTVRNTGATNLVITRLQTRGRVLTEIAPTVIEERDEASIREFRERSYLAPAQFINTAEDARAYAKLLLDGFKQPQLRADVTLEMSDHRGAAQGLDISDKVTLVRKGQRDDMFVESIRHTIQRGGRHYVALLLAASDYIDNLFVLGRSQLGQAALGR